MLQYYAQLAPYLFDFYFSLPKQTKTSRSVLQDGSKILGLFFMRKNSPFTLTLLRSERPKLHSILAFLSTLGLITQG